MQFEQVETNGDWVVWFEGLLDQHGAHMGDLIVGDIVSGDDEVVGLRIDRQKQCLIEFWGSGRHVEFDLTIDSTHFLIDQAHFVLIDAIADEVLCRVCRDECYAGRLGAEWHFHEGANGAHQARPQWVDWNVAEVLDFLANY